MVPDAGPQGRAGSQGIRMGLVTNAVPAMITNRCDISNLLRGRGPVRLGAVKFHASR